jgi:hypothetical protein
MFGFFLSAFDHTEKILVRGWSRVDGVPAACATAGLTLALFLFSLALCGAAVICVLARWCSYCFRYRGFDVDFTFYFH